MAVSAEQPAPRIDELLEELQALQARLVREQRLPRPIIEEVFQHLRAATDRLRETTASRPLRCPPEYRELWQRYLKDPTHLLPRRALRFLCWEWDIAGTREFLEYLHHHLVAQNERLNARALQGLVRASHKDWLRASASGGVVEVSRLVAGYDGPSRLLRKWQANLELVLGNDGPRRFAEWLLRETKSLSQGARVDFGFDDQTKYLRLAAVWAGSSIRDAISRGRVDLVGYLMDHILAWQSWPIDEFKEEVSSTILHKAADNESLRERLVPFVLKHPHLGDPRLNAKRRNWEGIDAARQRLRQWLSREDIEFFFRHVLPQKDDPHGRRPFWLRYVDRLVESRPFLNDEAYRRLDAEIRRRPDEFGHIGRLDSTTSAFVLVFDHVTVVEFSATGNACYVYKRGLASKYIGDLYDKTRFRVSDLKQTHLPEAKQLYGRPGRVEVGGFDKTWDKPGVQACRIVHRDGWEHVMAAILESRESMGYTTRRPS